MDIETWKVMNIQITIITMVNNLNNRATNIQFGFKTPFFEIPNLQWNS